RTATQMDPGFRRDDTSICIPGKCWDIAASLDDSRLVNKPAFPQEECHRAIILTRAQRSSR
ncbi:MAG: hypothetical protein RH951_11760, partial [Parvibaculum sp.]